MKPPLIVVYLMSVISVCGQGYEWQKSVIIQKIGKSDLFVFPASSVDSHPMGTIRVGDNIVVRYGLKLSPNSKARFIAMDALKTKSGVQPKLEVGTTTDTGFVVMDSTNKQLQVYFGEGLWKKFQQTHGNKAEVRQQMASQSNMNVEFTTDKKTGKVTISRVNVD